MRIRALALPIGISAALLAPVASATAVPNLFTGSSVEYPSGTGDAGGAIAAGSDNNIWFGYISLSGAPGGLNAMATGGGALAGTYAMPTSLFPPPYSDPAALTSGPDGRLWFVQGEGPSAPAMLGAVTTSGTYSAYPLPAGSTVGDMVSAGGALWIASGNAILRVGTTGQVAAQFPMPVGTSGASALTVAGDGTVWFGAAQQGGPVVGHLVPSTGQISFYAVPAPSGSQPSWAVGISAMGPGPDGNPWVLVGAQSQTSMGVPATRGSVLSIQPNGVMTPIASLGSYTCAIVGRCNLVSAQDGNAWFPSGNAMVRVTPSGTVTPYTVVTRTGNAQVAGPAIGPDRNLWFVDGITNDIGVLAMPGGNPIPAPTASMINGYRMGGVKRGRKLSVTFEAGQSAAGTSTVTISRGGRTVTLWRGNVRPGSTRTVSGTVPSSFPKGAAVVTLRTPKQAGRAVNTVAVS